jgi:phage gpG-like protein
VGGLMGVVIEKDENNIPKILAEMRKLENLTLEIGIFGDAGAIESGSLTYAALGAIHEFGASGAGRWHHVTIPERSFLRSCFDEKNGEWLQYLAFGVGKIFHLEMDATTLMERLGQRIKADVQMKITEISSPPNAPSTIAMKGSSNPLIDTGAMRGSVDYKVR